MTMRVQCAWILLAVAGMAAAVPSQAVAQEPRLVQRLADEQRGLVDGMLDSARVAGLPTEPLVDRALEGAAKGAPGDLIVSAVRRLWGELRLARDAFGASASESELTAGASALRAGATGGDLAELKTKRPGQPLTVAAAVLADLVAVGVPADTAIAAVLALATSTDDAQYAAFRRNVERDISLGASPAAALGVRLSLASADALSPETLSGAATRPTPPRKRKP